MCLRVQADAEKGERVGKYETLAVHERALMTGEARGHTASVLPRAGERRKLASRRAPGFGLMGRIAPSPECDGVYRPAMTASGAATHGMKLDHVLSFKWARG